jgi:hypothetical protein
MKRKIVVIAHDAWSIGRVHHDIGLQMQHSAHFTFYESSNFMMHDFLRDFHEADLCITTLLVCDGLIDVCKFTSEKDLRKLVAVCHGFEEIRHKNWSPHVNYATVSDVLLPFLPHNTHVANNGVYAPHFRRKEHSGKVALLGWAGVLSNPNKMSPRVCEIARKSKLPISIAESLEFQDMEAWYHTVDVLLVTSGPNDYNETGPLPPFEAIAAGVPVIGTSVGNFRKVPGPKFSTTDEAAAILSELKKDPERVKRLADEQYDWVMENWTYQTLVKEWREMFESILNPPPAKPFLDFIEIGTSDFDTEMEKKDEKIGVSIEPVKYYLDRLPNKVNCKKLNMAVSDHVATCKVNYVPEDMIAKHNLPSWVRGCNCINSYHRTVASLCLEKGFDIADIIATDTVPVSTLHKVMKNLDFEGVFLLKIDTEGHDTVILKQFFKDFAGQRRLLPHVVQFETNDLANNADVDEVIASFLSFGYDLVTRGYDTILKRNLHVKSNNDFTGARKNYQIIQFPPEYYFPGLHENTLEAAKEYCVKHQHSGVTLFNGYYTVRSGKYLEYLDDDVTSWVLT